MSSARVFVRVGQDNTTGISPALFATSFQRWLRVKSPSSRLTVFAQTPTSTLDFLYSEVDDLIPIDVHASPEDEVHRLGLRGTSEVSLIAGSIHGDLRRGIWRRSGKAMVVLGNLAQGEEAGRPIAAWVYADPEREDANEVLLGREWLLDYGDARPERASRSESVVVVLTHDLDPTFAEEMVARTLAVVRDQSRVVIAMDEGSSSRRGILREFSGQGPRVRSLRDLPRLADEAALAVVTTPEMASFCAVRGLPFLEVCPMRRGPASQENKVSRLGFPPRVTVADLSRAVSGILLAPAEHEALARAFRDAVNGRALDRVVATLLSPTVPSSSQLRDAQVLPDRSALMLET